MKAKTYVCKVIVDKILRANRWQRDGENQGWQPLRRIKVGNHYGMKKSCHCFFVSKAVPPHVYAGGLLSFLLFEGRKFSLNRCQLLFEIRQPFGPPMAIDFEVMLHLSLCIDFCFRIAMVPLQRRACNCICFFFLTTSVNVVLRRYVSAFALSLDVVKHASE